MAHSGEVVMWSENKGIGFIKSPDFKDDVYVHHSSFGGGSLIIGKSVTFEHDPKEGRALKVAGPAVDPRRPGRRGRRGSSVSSRGRSGGRRGPVFVVKFVDLARDVDDEDVLDLLEDYNVDVDERKVLFDSRADTCFVVLDTQDDFDYCVRKLDGKRLGRSDRRCRVMRSGDRDYARTERLLRDARRSRSRRGGRRDPSPRRRRSPSRGSSFSSRSRSRTPPRRSAKSKTAAAGYRSATPDRASAAAATPAATPAAAPAAAPVKREVRSRSRSRTPQEEKAGDAARGRKRERSQSSQSSRSARSATPTEKPEAKRARRSTTPERDQKEL